MVCSLDNVEYHMNIYIYINIYKYIYIYAVDITVDNYNMTVWILARKEINLSMAAGLIRLQMPGVK